jgi:hypothetical protein
MELRKSNMAENVWTWVTMADCADAEDGPRAEKVGRKRCADRDNSQ